MTDVPIHPPVASPAPESVTALDVRIGAHRRELTSLGEARRQSETALAQAHKDRAALEAQIRVLASEVEAMTSRSANLLGELDGLLSERRRLEQHAVREVAAIKAGRDDAAERPENRRVHPRTPVALEVTLQGETNFYVGFSQDISQGGLFIATYETEPVGTRFPIQFKLPTRDDPVLCMVEVAWVTAYAPDVAPRSGAVYGMGVCFVGLAAEDREAISVFQAQRDPLFFPEHEHLG